MARNVLSEHRLSDERFARFCALAGDMAAFDQVQAALESYQTAEVRPLIRDGLEPAYARADNASNAAVLPPRTYLATVLDLTRLGRVYAEARASFRLPQFDLYAVTDPRDSAQINAFLAPRLDDPDGREPFLRAVFRAMALYRRRKEDRVHPTWVAEWSSLQPFLDPVRPWRWLQAVGVPRENPVWRAVLRYPAENKRRKVQCFRPSQLDAGWYAHHFPSPPQAAVPVGGHTMFLDQLDERETEALVSEFLHAQIDFTIANWRAGGRLVGYTGRPVGGRLEEERREHWMLLQRSYESGRVRDWMPECL
jgi:hypothetical protein